MPTTLITGANRGIGLELARAYTASGSGVLACCRTPDEATELRKLGEQAGPGFLILELDVTDGASVAAAAKTIKGKPIDILINNAGVYGPREGQTIGSYDFEGWQGVLDANVLGPARVTEAFLPNLQQGERKIVATVSSQLGSMELSSGGIHAYRSSKAAVNAVMRALAMDLKGQGITTILLHPGWVSTDMGGEKAPVTPPESAAGIVNVLNSLGQEDSGSFVDWTGKRLPW